MAPHEKAHLAGEITSLVVLVDHSALVSSNGMLCKAATVCYMYIYILL